MNYAVEVCPICDIAGCRHIREKEKAMTDNIKPNAVERYEPYLSQDWRGMCGVTAIMQPMTLGAYVRHRDYDALSARLDEEIEISNKRGNHIEFDLLPQMADLSARVAELEAERRFILDERDQTFALMLARADPLNVEGDAMTVAYLKGYADGKASIAPRVVALVGAIQGARQAKFEGCDADAFAMLDTALAKLGAKP
jgi:hypothetical protein